MRVILGGRQRQVWTVPLFALICSLAASALLLLVLGKSPLDALIGTLQGAGVVPKENYAGGVNFFTDFSHTLSMMTPMLFASLAVCVAFKTGLFNIGVSGQMLFAGFAATALVGYSSLPAAAAVPLILLIGIAAGALIGGVIGLLKHAFNINEVVSSIMLNYIISYTTGYFINTKYIDPVTRVSRNISEQTRTVLKYVKTDGLWKEFRIGGYNIEIPYLLILAAVVSILLYVFFASTKTGLELTAVGQNKRASKYFGIATGRSLMISMLISGGLAGLAGVSYYLGYNNNIIPYNLVSTGFDAIAVSLLGSSNPIGCIFSSALITIISSGTTYLTKTIAVKREIAQVITGIILLFSACGEFIKYLVNKTRED